MLTSTYALAYLKAVINSNKHLYLHNVLNYTDFPFLYYI